MAARTDPDFFEALYRDDPAHDPWGFAEDQYEQARYRTLDDLLGGQRLSRALEPGCSIGAFTRLLARRCDHVDAIDVSVTAVAEARHRNSDLPGVHHDVGSFPDWALGSGDRYDLVCLVEIGYYFDARRLAEIALDVVDLLLSPGGVVLVSHWTGESDDHVLGGHDVHEVIDRVLADAGLERTSGPLDPPGFVAEVWHHHPGTGDHTEAA